MPEGGNCRKKASSKYCWECTQDFKKCERCLPDRGLLVEVGVALEDGGLLHEVELVGRHLLQPHFRLAADAPGVIARLLLLIPEDEKEEYLSLLKSLSVLISLVEKSPRSLSLCLWWDLKLLHG